MTQHQRPGLSDEHLTPAYIFDALGLVFDLDPAQPEQGRAFLSVPARRHYTKRDDGLAQPWDGLVWMNPPFGGRNGVVPWLKRFLAHGNGIAVVNALTSSGWWHAYATQVDAMLFPDGKTKFIAPDGRVQKQPNYGVALLACGDVSMEALRRSGLGWFVDNRRRAAA